MYQYRGREIPFIIDSTLRDGEQAPGVVFNRRQREEIADLLDKCGVDEIEGGSPVLGAGEIDFLRWCSFLHTPVSCWCRADEEDIGAAKKTGLERIHISVPASDILLRAMGRSRWWVIARIHEAMSLSRGYFSRVSLGLMDATRCGTDFLRELLDAAEAAGYCRVRVADTVGIASPVSVAELFKSIDDREVPIEFHGHNDFGMATANAVTALQCGAAGVSATVLGIGERAGNARLEEVWGYLTAQGNRGGGPMDLRLMKELCVTVSRALNRPVPEDKPLMGSNAFLHESGIHVSATLKDPLSFLPVLPESLGLGSTGICVGRHSGTRSIQYVLGKRGINIKREMARELLPEIRRAAEEKEHTLDPDEVEAIYYEFINAKTLGTPECV